MSDKVMVNEWVDVDKIIDDNPACSWILIWGQRSNGKTYGTIERVMREGKRFAYIRRYDNEITRKEINDLISPHDIVKLTNGEYNDYEYKSGKFTYVVRDQNGKVVKTAPRDFGMTFSLNTWERYKGADRDEPTILRVEYKNDTISTKPSYISDSPTPTDTQKQFNLNHIKEGAYPPTTEGRSREAGAMRGADLHPCW